MDLKAKIRKLIEMQELDSRIHILIYKKDVVNPAKINKLRTNFEEKKGTLSSFEDKAKQLRLKRKEEELALASQEERIKKLQLQLYQLKTNKEYQKKMIEIKSCKADVSLAEDNILKLMDESQAAEMQLQQARAKISAEEKMSKDSEREINKDIEQLTDEIGRLRDKKRIISQELSKDILSIYERLVETRSGKAIAAVEHYNCSACYINVTAQKVNEIKMYSNLVYCDNCVRILYIKDDFQ